MNASSQLKQQLSRFCFGKVAICRPALGLRLVSTGSASSLQPKQGGGHEDGWFWPHPVYSIEDMESIKIAHRNAKSFSDKVALSAVTTMRWCFDKATGYKRIVFHCSF